jgi:DNA-binding NtrC family response regulator
MEQPRKKALFIEMDDGVGQATAHLLAQHFEVKAVHANEETLQIARDQSPDVIVFNGTLPSVSASEWLVRLRECAGLMPILVLSPVGEVRRAVDAIKCGATEVIEGLPTPRVLSEAISEIVHNAASAEVASSSARRISRREAKLVQADFGPMAGRSAAMQALFLQVEQVATRDTTVLITGESGTGKELIAREIHNRSARKHKPFVAINCAAIPESLIESELFGHEKGAFTHAVDRRLGHFELADGGTLFLDEIGELSLAVQVKLLRFLQEQEFFRVGRSRPISVDVRVITATNRNLEDLVRIKQFRQDLLYRINVINLHIPALRDRASDIPVLAQHCASRLSPLYGGRNLKLTPEVMESFQAYPWPGNVRELENVMEGLLALAPHDDVLCKDLPRKIREWNRSPLETPVPGAVNSSGLAFGEAERLFETDMIVKALKKANFVQTRAAELLGISRRILKYKMDKLNINELGEVKAQARDTEN